MLITCNSDTPAPSTISQNGITWTFSAPVTQGQFVTGDYWVVAPVTVSSVSPAWGDIANTHGSMVNPDPSRNDQGYDNRSGMLFTYNAAKRATFPLVMAAGDSLVSTIGKTTPVTGGGATHIRQAAVLTCLAAAPAATAFRPPYAGTSKTIYTTADINTGLLPNLAVPSGCTVPDMTISAGYCNRLWLDHGNLQTNHSQIFPEDNCTYGGGKGYPVYRALQLGQMALLALTTHAQASAVRNRLIQYGIDQHACMAVNTDTWGRQGGFGFGRKWPILFAELMLGQSWSVPFYVTGSSGQKKFQEDSHTYLGDPGGTTARWGEICDTAGFNGVFSGNNHTCRPTLGDIDQYAMYYLGVSGEGTHADPTGGYEITTHSLGVGVSLAARLMSHAWVTDWPAAHSYADRYVNTIADEIDANAGGFASPPFVGDAGFDVHTTAGKIDIYKYGGEGNKFMKRMWETYR